MEEKCKKILEDYIKNIKPDLYIVLLEELLISNIDNTKQAIENYVRKRLDLTTISTRHSQEYWRKRGWTDAESYIKAKENKQNNKSPFSREFWVEKINPQTGIHYTIEEADFERNSRRPIRPEYWIKKGFSNSEADQLAFDTKDINNKTGAKNTINSVVNRAKSKRCVEYYTARGFTNDEAKTKVSQAQVTFSKQICIEKHGKLVGETIWQQRQDKWQLVLNSKSSEEKARINLLKLTKGITFSKNERHIFEEIKKVIPSTVHQFSIEYENKRQYVYDIMANNKIIEYNGDFWHSNPDLYYPEFINKRTKVKASDKWELDSIKIKHAQNNGYEVLVVWENDFKKNKEEIINKCIQFLTQ